MRLNEILNLFEAPEDGTFAGMRFYEQDAQKLAQFALDNEIPNPVSAEKMHVTVLYSRKPIPDFKPWGLLKKAVFAMPIEAKIFGEGDEKALVIVLDCPELVARHKYLMNHHKEATWDHNEYIPHVTLSYDAGDIDLERLDVSSIGMLTLVEEYAEDIDSEWDK